MNESLKPAEVKSPLDDYLRIAKNQNAEGRELASKLSAILLSLRDRFHPPDQAAPSQFAATLVQSECFRKFPKNAGESTRS